MNCQYCDAIIDSEDYTLCVHCELMFAGMLMRCARDVIPLTDSLDATLHPGGHSPVRIQPTMPPTPIRLDVLDLLDLLDATATELQARLDGVDALTPKTIPPTTLAERLLDCAAHPRLSLLPDGGMYMTQIQRLSQLIDRTLDPPELRREIGPCELCGGMLTAGPDDQWVTCPTCNREQRVLTVKLKRLERLCFDTTHTGTAAQIATTFTTSGITLKRHTITVWATRGKITAVGKKNGKPIYSYANVYRRVIAPAA